ncbi:MAG: FAD-dependent oxidoreductase [Candidatus Levyibacteriota bacterium]
MKLIDNFLDSITMYRLVLYYLILLLVVAFLFCLGGVLPYNPLMFVLSVLFLLATSWIANKVFSLAYDAPTNVESVYISALILALIISPMKSFADLPLLFWAAVLTMASKYILTIKSKHIFNPVAVAVVLTAIGFNGSASWWIGTGAMLPFSLLGMLIVRKIRRWDLVFYFFAAAIVTIFGFSMMQGSDLLTTLKAVLFSSPIFFFACVILTEPLTTPPTKILQSVYGAIVGVLFAPQFHIGTFYLAPEMALVIGNIFSYIVSPKDKVVSTVKQKLQIAPDMLDFLIAPTKKLAFTPGQYMEWTLPHKNTDSRGNRRYFTIASSPTEDTLRLGVKFYPNGSSYKKAMAVLGTNTPIVGAQLSGDFVLPKDVNQKLVFIAGGIGITPFRSILKYLIDIKQKRPIIQFYANKNASEIAYADVFNAAQQELGIKTVYTLTDTSSIPSDWKGKTGRIDATMITEEVPDFKERIFYLSGPHAMVEAYKETLRNMGVPSKHIKVDFFPGFM